jgi:hypothetical protein
VVMARDTLNSAAAGDIITSVLEQFPDSAPHHNNINPPYGAIWPDLVNLFRGVREFVGQVDRDSLGEAAAAQWKHLRENGPNLKSFNHMINLVVVNARVFANQLSRIDADAAAIVLALFGLFYLQTVAIPTIRDHLTSSMVVKTVTIKGADVRQSAGGMIGDDDDDEGDLIDLAASQNQETTTVAAALKLGRLAQPDWIRLCEQSMQRCLPAAALVDYVLGTSAVILRLLFVAVVAKLFSASFSSSSSRSSSSSSSSSSSRLMVDHNKNLVLSPLVAALCISGAQFYLQSRPAVVPVTTQVSPGLISKYQFLELR